ncbi:MAG TPA: transglycosylase SLT domain-containing protein [Xanthobacteraceae bacterium]|jgi:hypothetical protein|nr:transglycosylase SLT domain-containing protein [Xanthobacteraceae bacterium]
MFLDDASSATAAIGSRITSAIQRAAQATGAGFDYLLKTALRESNFDPNAKASTSSATGLFQFIDQTWLSTLKEAGPSLGYGGYAEAIVKTSSGAYAVPDAAMRDKVMNLRYDPTANAVMAGAFTKMNSEHLAAGIGRQPTDGELYMAHFLGPAGAVKLINATAKTPQASAASMFPAAAHANRSIFFDRSGSPRSLGQVYDKLAGSTESPALTAIASAVPPVPPPTPIAPPSATLALSSDAIAPSAPIMDSRPVFHSLFSTERRTPVSPVVSELWGAASASPTASTNAPVSNTDTPVAAMTRVGAPLDLFQFLRPEIRVPPRPV